MSSPTMDSAQQQYYAQYAQYFPQGYQQQSSNPSYMQAQLQPSQNDDPQSKAHSQQPYQQATSQDQTPEMRQYEEQMRQYNIQLKQYEDYQKALQQQQQQQAVQTSTPPKTQEEIRYEQEMKEYQKQKAEFEKYQQDMAEYEKKKQEWERQQRGAYPSVTPGPSAYGAPGQVPNTFGVNYPPNFGVAVNGAVPTGFAPNNFAAPGGQFAPNYAQNFVHPYAAPGVFGQQSPPTGGFGAPSGANSRSISLPFAHLSLLLTRKNEIENGAKAKLTIRDPPAAGADFGVFINAGSPASLEMATTLIDRLVRSNSPSGGVWRGDQRDVRNAAGVFPAPGTAIGVKDPRERCRDFYSSGVCGRGQRCIFRHESPPGALSKLPPVAAPIVGVVRPGVPHPLLDNRYARPAGAWPAVDDSRKRMREFEGTQPAMFLDPRRGVPPGPFNDVRRFPGSVTSSDAGPYPRFAPKEGLRLDSGSTTTTLTSQTSSSTTTSPNSETPTPATAQEGALPSSAALDSESTPSTTSTTSGESSLNSTSNDTTESITVTSPSILSSSSSETTSASSSSQSEPVTGASDLSVPKIADGDETASSSQAHDGASASTSSSPLSQDNASTPTPIAQDNALTPAPITQDNAPTPTPTAHNATPIFEDNPPPYSEHDANKSSDNKSEG